MVRQNNYPLLKRNTFGMDVKCTTFIEYSSENELKAILSDGMLSGKKYLHIGGGSNLLFTGNFEGVVLHSDIKFINKVNEDDEHVWLEVGAGVVWDDFCAYAADNSLAGAENLSYIPGEVGASAIQNIGAYGVEASDIIDKVKTVSVDAATDREFDVKECHYGYRHSIFKSELKDKYIVTSVIFRLDKTPHYKLDYGNLRSEVEKYGELSLSNVRKAVIAIRKSKLPEPSEAGNAGSFFMNPVIPAEKYQKLLQEYPAMPRYVVDSCSVKVPAAWLIEQCGWKGKQHGGAAVHDRQCLVLINKDKATAVEVQELALMICATVKGRFGITITPEVNYI